MVNIDSIIYENFFSVFLNIITILLLSFDLQVIFYFFLIY